MSRYSPLLSGALIAAIGASAGWWPMWLLPISTNALSNGLAVLGIYW